MKNKEQLSQGYLFERASYHGLKENDTVFEKEIKNAFIKGYEASEMTLLDYFAGLILCGTLSDPDAVGSAKSFANNSYVIAAAMIEERKKHMP